MKLGGWVIMLTTMIIVLTLVGVDTGLSSILDFLGISSTGVDFGNSTFSIALLVALGVIGTGGIIVGFFAKSYDPTLIITPFLITIAGFYIKTFVSIVSLVNSYSQTWMTYIAVVLFGALAVGFGMSVMNYFSGR